MDEDELIDALPLSLRNKVLDAIDVTEDGKVIPFPKGKPQLQQQPTKKRRKGLWIALAIPIFFLWTLPLVMIGIVLSCTIILAIIGVPIAYLGIYPFSIVMFKAMGA